MVHLFQWDRMFFFGNENPGKALKIASWAALIAGFLATREAADWLIGTEELGWLDEGAGLGVGLVLATIVANIVNGAFSKQFTSGVKFGK